MSDNTKRASQNFIHLKKRLGQHLLSSNYFLEKIISDSGICDKDHILEIGPGTGNLTKKLVENAEKVVAIEIDERFRNILNQIKSEISGDLTIIYKDILKTDLSSCLERRHIPWKVMANIPYYITSSILEKILLESRDLFSDIYLAVQKEIALRICCENDNSNKSSLSMFVEYYSKPKLLFDIPASAFIPPPEVDSSFVHLKIRDNPPVKTEPDILFRLIRKAFGQRRKVIKNSLRGLYPLISDDVLDSIIQECGVNPMERPQNLSLSDFDRIVSALEKKSV